MSVAPLTSSEMDLRSFPYMPLDVVRLRDSDTAILTTGDGFRAAVLLWCAAWHQVPAASLPDDDRALAHLAGFGRDLTSWADVRADALRGFVKCSDGRLYHPTIAEKAKEAWESKLQRRKRTEAARGARHATNDVASSVTENVTASVTESNREERRGEEGNNLSKIVDHGREGKRAKRAAPALVKISMDLALTTECLEVADDFGLTSVARDAEWRAFLTNKTANGAEVADVAAAFRQWCGRIGKFGSAPEPRASTPSTAPALVRIERKTPHGDAWEAHYRATRKRGVPWNDGVWRFPTEWPPGAGPPPPAPQAPEPETV